MLPGSPSTSDPPLFEVVDQWSALRKGARMTPIILLVVAIVLFLIATFNVTIPHVPHPEGLGFAFLAAAILWPLAAKLGGG